MRSQCSDSSSHLIDVEVEELIDSIGVLGLDPLVDGHLLVFRDTKDFQQLLSAFKGVLVKGVVISFFLGLLLLFLWLVLRDGGLLVVFIEVLKGFFRLLLIFSQEFLLLVLKGGSDGFLDGIFLGNSSNWFSTVETILVSHAVLEHILSLREHLLKVLLTTVWLTKHLT